MSADLEALVAAGVVRPSSTELLAPVPTSVLAEASLAAAASPEQRHQAVELVGQVLDETARLMSIIVVSRA